MRDYIVTISVTALVVSVLEIFAPKEWEKYIKLGIGLVIMSVMLSPVGKFRCGKINFKAPEYTVKQEEFYAGIIKKLKTDIERDIEERLKNEFNIDSDATVEIETDEDSNITGVKSIRIHSRKNPGNIEERLEEIYGCSKIEIKTE